MGKWDKTRSLPFPCLLLVSMCVCVLLGAGAGPAALISGLPYTISLMGGSWLSTRPSRGGGSSLPQGRLWRGKVLGGASLDWSEIVF